MAFHRRSRMQACRGVRGIRTRACAGPFPGPSRRRSCRSAGKALQRGSEQGQSIVCRHGRRPCPDVADPGERHFGSADFGDHRDRVSVERNHDEPRPCRALPELGVEAAEISHVRRCRYEEGIQPVFPHDGLGPPVRRANSDGVNPLLGSVRVLVIMRSLLKLAFVESVVAVRQDSLRITANDRVVGGRIRGCLGIDQENAAVPVQPDHLSRRAILCDGHQAGEAGSAALAADDRSAPPEGRGPSLRTLPRHPSPS